MNRRRSLILGCITAAGVAAGELLMRPAEAVANAPHERTGMIERPRIAALVKDVSFAHGRESRSQTTATRARNEPIRQIALTFDDLPATGGRSCDAAYIRDVTAKLTGVLQSHSVPAMGLATPGSRCMTPALLEEMLGAWQRTGAIIGNHSATHPDLNSTPVEAYLADIGRAQALIDSAVQTDTRWFRPPLLHMGNTEAKQQALRAYLTANGYRLAPVTVDNQEFVYAAVYAATRSRGDDKLAARVADGYVLHLQEAVAYYERLSKDVFGREIPLVLLLHANLLNAEHLGRAIDMLAGRGYAFVSVPEALADSAYARRDTYVGPRGLSWIQRWALDAGVKVPPEPREAPWVARAFQATQRSGAEEASVRAALRHYLAGHATGIGAHFDSVFHDMSNLYWVANDSLRTRTGQSYIAGAPGRPASDEARRGRRIVWVEVTGDVAVARIDLDYPAARFTDYMSLLRTNGEWRIVTKIFHIDRSRAVAASTRLPDPRQEIAAASRAFSQAYVAGDTATIRALYTPDAVLLPPDGQVRGRDAIARYFAPGPRANNVAHSMTSEDLRIADGSATDVGTWRHTRRTVEGETREAAGRYLVVWRRGEDGRWRIEYDMWHRPATP